MVSAKDSLASLRINPLRLQFEVFRQRGRDVARAPVNADALRQTHQSRRQQCMICDVDRVAVCQSCFHLLGKDGCSREAANELKACFGALRKDITQLRDITVRDFFSRWVWASGKFIQAPSPEI